MAGKTRVRWDGVFGFMGLAGTRYNHHALQIASRGRLQAARQGVERLELGHQQELSVVEREGAPAGLAVYSYLFCLFDYCFIVDLTCEYMFITVHKSIKLYISNMEPSPVSGGGAE